MAGWLVVLGATLVAACDARAPEAAATSEDAEQDPAVAAQASISAQGAREVMAGFPEATTGAREATAGFPEAAAGARKAAGAERLTPAGAERLAPAGAQDRLSAPIAGKPVAPFEIEHELSGKPTVSVPLDVRIVFRPQMPADEIELQLSADEGLALNPVDETLTARAAGPDAPAEWHVVVVPLMDGVQRLRVYAEASVGGERQGRSIVIPIRIASTVDLKATPHTGAAADTDADAEHSAADVVEEGRSGERVGQTRTVPSGARGSAMPAEGSGRVKRDEFTEAGPSDTENTVEPGSPERIIRLPSSAPPPRPR